MQAVSIELFVAIEEICTEAVHVPVDEPWIIDSGASPHMTSRKDWYTSLHSVGNDILVAVGNDAKCPTKEKGTIALKSDGVVKQLSNVLYVPDIKRNLLSIFAITNQDLKVHFDKNDAQILDLQGKVIDEEAKGYHLYNFATKKIIVSHDVVFSE